MYISFLILVVLLLSFLVLRKTRENFQENEKPLLFIHIPKTGGTYVEKIFNKYNYIFHIILGIP